MDMPPILGLTSLLVPARKGYYLSRIRRIGRISILTYDLRNSTTWQHMFDGIGSSSLYITDCIGFLPLITLKFNLIAIIRAYVFMLA